MPIFGTRRDMLAMTALGAVAAGTAPALGAAKGEAGMLIVNALGGLENPNLALTRKQSDNPVGVDQIDVDARAIADAHASGVTAVNITLGYVGGPEEPYEYTIRTIGMWDDVLRAHPNDLMRVETAADILAQAKGTKVVTLVYGARDTEHNEAVVLRGLFERAAAQKKR